MDFSRRASHSMPNDASVFANVMPAGPPPAVRTGTSFMGFLCSPGWGTYSVCQTRRCIHSRSGRSELLRSSLLGSRLLHSANSMGENICHLAKSFFSPDAKAARVLAKPVESRTRPSNAWGERAQNGHTRPGLSRPRARLFLRLGSEGASWCCVAKRAGAARSSRPTISQDQGRKLWMAVMDLNWPSAHPVSSANRIRGLEGVDAATKLRLVVREFVKYSARRSAASIAPVAMEGLPESERLVWLIERHVSRFFAISTKLIREAQALGVVGPGRLRSVALLRHRGRDRRAFRSRPNTKCVTGKDQHTLSHVEQIADLVCDYPSFSFVPERSVGGELE